MRRLLQQIESVIPVVVRPSYVLGGRDMRIVYNDQGIKDFMIAVGGTNLEHPILIDKFLKDAIEVDVDAICDGTADHHRRHP